MIKKMIMLYFAALAVMGAGAAMEDVSSLTIVLHKNDGTGMTRELMVRHNTSITLPGAVKTLKWAPRRGFSFMGWAISEKSKNIFLKDQSKWSMS